MVQDLLTLHLHMMQLRNRTSSEQLPFMQHRLEYLENLNDSCQRKKKSYPTKSHAKETQAQMSLLMNYLKHILKRALQIILICFYKNNILWL